MLLRNPSGDIEQSVGYGSGLGVGAGGRAGDVHLGVFSMNMMFRAMREMVPPKM